MGNNLINTEIPLVNRMTMGNNQQTLSVSDFYSHSYPDTKRLKMKEYHRKWYLKNKDTKKYKEYHHRCNNNYRLKHPEKYREWDKRYYEKHKQKCFEKLYKYKKRHPDRCNARLKAFKNIKIEGKSCSNCGSKEHLQRHHPDYSKPLKIIVLCKNCHKNIHKRSG